MSVEAQRARLLAALSEVASPEVVTAMSRVPRQEFMPEGHRAGAYVDAAIPLGYGATLSQPTMVAIVLEQLRLVPGLSVFEAGSGCGYLLALMEKLGCAAYGAEIVNALCEASRRTLSELGVRAEVRCSDAKMAYTDRQFDRVVFSAAVRVVPEWALERITPEGFVLAPAGDARSQELVRVSREGTERTGCLCRFVPFQ